MENSPVVPGSPYFIMTYDTAKKLKSIVIIVLLFDSQILNIQLLKLQPDKPICLWPLMYEHKF